MIMSQKKDVVLRLEKVTKKAGKQVIVDNLSFEVNKGEVVGLLGPNGAGKTTTIRMIVGLIQMTDGDIFIKGSSVKSDFTKAVKHLGAIVENPEFYPYMTGWDNLKQYQRMMKGITDKRIEEVVEIVGLSAAMSKKVKSYSLGMRQRLGIAQALLHSPSILILDEPTNGLDPAGIREMRDYLKRIAQEEGIAVLVSSHLLSEMELMCSRVVIIQKGKFIREQYTGTAEIIENNDRELTFMLRVSNLAKAEELAAAKQIKLLKINELSNQLLLQCKDDTLALFIAELCQHEIMVYRAEEIKKTLEDEFLEWTGGNSIA